VPIF
jgi:hypothetical protein